MAEALDMEERVETAEEYSKRFLLRARFWKSWPTSVQHWSRRLSWRRELEMWLETSRLDAGRTVFESSCCCCCHKKNTGKAGDCATLKKMPELRALFEGLKSLLVVSMHALQWLSMQNWYACFPSLLQPCHREKVRSVRQYTMCLSVYL